MRRVRLLISAAVFLIFTVIKFISPASAVQLKSEILPILERNDDVSPLMHQLERTLHPVDYHDASPYDPKPPLTELRRTLEELAQDPLADLPKAEFIPAPEPMPETDPALE